MRKEAFEEMDRRDDQLGDYWRMLKENQWFENSDSETESAA